MHVIKGRLSGSMLQESELCNRDSDRLRVAVADADVHLLDTSFLRGLCCCAMELEIQVSHDHLYLPEVAKRLT